MKRFDKALIAAFRADATLVALTNYTTSHLSIAMTNPKQKYIIPGMYAEADYNPLIDADNTGPVKSVVIVSVVAKEKATVLDIATAIKGLFHDVSGNEKKFDISNAEVYCVHSKYGGVRSPTWEDDFDCFESAISLEFVWELV